MDQNGAEQNKTEEATPHKLRRARERGMVARGADLGFFSALSGFAAFVVIAGTTSVARFAESMRRALATPDQALASASGFAEPFLGLIALLSIAVVAPVILFEIVQVRGLVFTTKPLKPDFNRLNPAEGLKRLFSFRMLKETLKSLVKLVAYSVAGFIALKYAFDTFLNSTDNAVRLAAALEAGFNRLLFSFIFVALIVAIIDQGIARGEFRKQMRMSRSELTREHREREGEPRLKQKRKQLHAEFASQTRSLNGLAGSDMLIVNPEHYAVALRYDRAQMEAPTVTAKGRNSFALQLKRKAALLSIPIFEQPALARALYRACDTEGAIPGSKYREVADLYLRLARLRRREVEDARRA